MNAIAIPIRSSDRRLSRHINHDPTSERFGYDTTGLSIVDVEHATHLNGLLNQGNVGDCTANAADNVLASDPFFATLPAKVSAQLAAATQVWPQGFYHDETLIDPYDGVWPPDDTGSDGLTSGKVAKARGLIAGYQWTFTATDALKALSQRPASWGTVWKSGMDEVNTSTGQCTYTGASYGGHQLALYKVVAAAEQVWFRNSWGPWGFHDLGVGWLSFDDFARSLADQGDVTFYVPNTSPAPIPTPVPTPVDPSRALWAANAPWRRARHVGSNAAAVRAEKAWGAAMGYPADS